MPPKKKRKIIPMGRKIPIDERTDSMRCRFCHQGMTQDVLKSGDFYSLTVEKQTNYYHYFCLLFSRDGIQKGEDHEGIEGFLAEAIGKEYQRGLKLKCHICKKKGATVECNTKKCGVKYHFPCGALYQESKNEHFFIFKENMCSFCPVHAPKQKRQNKTYNDTCSLCLETFDNLGPGTGRFACIQDLCHGVFHRFCIQNHAEKSCIESFFCSLCRDKEKFQQEALRMGIYIPHASATWETDESYRWDAITVRSCAAKRCLCREGRDHNVKGSKYELYTCDCGGEIIHIECGRINQRNPSYQCEICKVGNPESEEAEGAEEEEGAEENQQEEEQPENGESNSESSEDDEKIEQALASYRVTDEEEEEITVLEEKPSLINQRRREIEDALRQSPSNSEQEDDEIQVLDRQQPGVVARFTTPWGTPLTILPPPDQPVKDPVLRWGSPPTRDSYKPHKPGLKRRRSNIRRTQIRQKKRVPGQKSNQVNVSSPQVNRQSGPKKNISKMPKRSLGKPSSRRPSSKSGSRQSEDNVLAEPWGEDSAVTGPTARSSPSNKPISDDGEPSSNSLLERLLSSPDLPFTIVPLSPERISSPCTPRGLEKPVLSSNSTNLRRRSRRSSDDEIICLEDDANESTFLASEHYNSNTISVIKSWIPAAAAAVFSESSVEPPAKTVRSTRLSPPEEIVLLDSSSEDESEVTSIGIQIGEVYGGEELEHNAQSEFQSFKSRVHQECRGGPSETSAPDHHQGYSTSELAAQQESDDEIQIIEDVLPKPVPALWNRHLS